MRLAAIAAMLLLAAPIATRAQESDAGVLANAEALFQRAVEQQRSSPEDARRLFEQSAAMYEQLTADVSNADLCVNLGNARLLAGDTGRAVLAYRRAELIRPKSGAIAASLEHARAQVEATVEPPDLGWWGAMIRPVQSPLARRLFWVVAVVGWIGGWSILAARTCGKQIVSVRVACSCILLAALCAVFLEFEAWTSTRSPAAVLITQQQGLRGPGEGVYTASFDAPLPPGVELTIQERRGEWVRVRLADGRETWVRASAVEAI